MSLSERFTRDSRFTAEYGDAPRWKKVRRGLCEECNAQQTQLDNPTRAVWRRVANGLSLLLCDPHASEWRERDTS